MKAKQIAEKYVYGTHNALTDVQEIKDMTSDIEDYAKGKTELLKACKEALNEWHSKISNFRKKEPIYLEMMKNAIKIATKTQIMETTLANINYTVTWNTSESPIEQNEEFSLETISVYNGNTTQDKIISMFKSFNYFTAGIIANKKIIKIEVTTRIIIYQKEN